MSAITPTELAARLRGANPPHLLDVREAAEHALCALPGSTLLPLSELAERAAELAAWKNEEIVVYCHHGVRSARAIGFLRGLRFMHLRNLTGGIDRWSVEVDSLVPRY